MGSEATGKTAPSSSLAITEKRASHRPGGCVGIFFQLFDWNRRFAKKKLFSKKLLPPGRSKQASKRFGGDEKMPNAKLHLIADENSGGFPNVMRKKGRHSVDVVEQKHEMRAASLVARLMGLESLPAVVNRDNKHKKGLNSVASDAQEERFGSSYTGSDREDVNLVKGGTKVESRPQKIQKTGQFERRAVTRFGAEALQIKGVLSRSRKYHHHPRLASPVKSPRLSSSRNSSRTSMLIDAATRILEPGLQATNKAKCALTYSNTANHASKNKVLTEGPGTCISLPDLAEQHKDNPTYALGTGKALMGQASCRNCGNLIDVIDSEARVEEQPFVCLSSGSNLANAFSERPEIMKPRPPASSFEQEREVLYQRCQDQLPTADDEQGNLQAYAESTVDRKSPAQECQEQWQLRSQQCKYLKDETSFAAYEPRIQTQKEKSARGNGVPPREKVITPKNTRASASANALNGTKDFVALNRNLSGHIRPRVFTRSNDSSLTTEKKFCGRQGDSSSQQKAPMRKRSANTQIESKAYIASTAGRQRNVKQDLVCGSGLGHNVFSAERPDLKTRSCSARASNQTNDNRGNNAISFTFSSSSRHKEFTSTDFLGRTNQIDEITSRQRILPMDEKDSKISMLKGFPLRGPALGALLEQKLGELTSQEEDEFTSEGTPHKRSTAAILHELIAAFTVEQPVSPSGHKFNSDTSFQAEGLVGGASIGFLNNGDHLSPGSVLEASFSNNSYFSSSFDDSSGRKLLPDFLDYSYDWQQPTVTDADLLDSAISLHEGSKTGKMVSNFLSHIMHVLQSINLGCGGLISGKLSYAKEVITNAELVFENAALPKSDTRISSLLGSFLLDELDTLPGAMWTNINCLLGFEESKDGNQLRRFLFDCLVECLDLRYGSGFKSWRRVHTCTNTRRLSQEVAEEVRRWAMFAGMIPDEIIEWEMSHSLGKWTDFNIEAFEAGAEIDWDILQVLVEELAIDLWECGTVSMGSWR